MKKKKLIGRSVFMVAAILAVLAFIAGPVSAAKAKKPNILVIMADDIGYWNVSYNNRGMMGYKTPNIDRIAGEGMIFTDYYAEQSCTAGRSAFITGQSTVRTGLTKVGVPGSPLGLHKDDPTLAELLKNHGYATGQFGKNHLGDSNAFLPTVHGFDEFFGNLYHLNAEEEPEHPDYPKDPAFLERFGPRGVLNCKATDKDDKTVDPRFGKVGKQTIVDTGPLTRKRMETVDEEFLAASKDFIHRAKKADTPFFVWFNPSRMHFYTHIKPEHQGISGQNFYADGMVEHDMHVGEILKLLDDLKIADNTIVIYTTDNGPHYNEWPDGGIAPFRGEKNTNWEGGFRVPTIIRWPGHIKAGSVSNEIVSAQDWVPTLMAAVGDPDIKEKLKKGHKAGNKTFKVHLDGYNQLAYLTGKEEKGSRKEFFYFSDDAELMGLRYNDWKFVFMEQRAHRFDVWRDPLVLLRGAKLFNLRRDPFERADTDSNMYNRWWCEHAFMGVPAQAISLQFANTFRKFPPRQGAAKFNVEATMDILKELTPATAN